MPLTPEQAAQASIADLELAFLKSEVLVPTGSTLSDYRRDFWTQGGPVSGAGSISDKEMAFLRQAVPGLTLGTLADYRRAYWENELSGEVVPDPDPEPILAPFRSAWSSSEAPPVALDSGQALRVESGTWTSGSGTLQAAADGAIIAFDLASTTQTVEYTISGTPGGQSFPTILLNYDNSNDWHYRVQRGTASSNDLKCERRDPANTSGTDGIWRTVANSVPHIAGTKIRVSVSGPVGAKVFRLWVNDVELTALLAGSWADADGTPPNGTEAGFRYGAGSGGATFSIGPVNAWPTVEAA